MSTAFDSALKRLFNQQDLLTSAPDLAAYSYDNSSLQCKPMAVCFVRQTEQVQELVNLCRKHHVALVARGRGTGTTGASVPVENSIALSFERMNQLLSIDSANRLARVEPGLTNEALQTALAKHGFFWPPDPTSKAVCTIGGNLACNSAGPRAVKYGTPRENTLGLSAVTGTGQIIHTGTQTTKGVVGYDLTRLLIGSEGTLALITQATLKLTPLSEGVRTMQAVYDSVEAAALAVSAIMAQPHTPCALEFMDDAALKLIRQQGVDIPDQAQALLMIEVDGSTAELEEAARQVEAAARVPGLLHWQRAETPQQVAALWKSRKALSPALRSIAPKKINEDVVVPVSRIPELVSGLRDLSRRYAIPIVNFGHAGNGNLHVNLLIDPSDTVQAENASQCLDEVFSLVLALDGTLSGEHGIGAVKRAFVSREIKPASLVLMNQIKQVFDPDNILNPGKTIPPP